MKINTKMITSGNEVYYTMVFKNIIETYLPSLRLDKDNYIIHITSLEYKIYENDLNGFLLYKNIDSYLHWIIMRLNNLYSTYDFTKEVPYLYVPNINSIDKIRQLYETKIGSIGL